MEQEAINAERQRQIQAFMENRPERIPRPRDSASLILLRRAAGGVHNSPGTLHSRVLRVHSSHLRNRESRGLCFGSCQIR